MHRDVYQNFTRRGSPGAYAYGVKRKQHLLIVEDEEAIRTGLADVFVYHGYDVTTAADGNEGLTLALSRSYDLILLDIMMPGRNGFEVCEAVRARHPDQAVIMLTAKISDDDIVQGLRLGADDYVAKPFSVEQLVLRVAAVLRRTAPDPGLASEIKLGGVTVDAANLCAHGAGLEDVRFTRREMEVLTYLAANAERPVPREELLAKVWGYANEDSLETRTVDIHVAKLRKKLEADPKDPRFLVTVRGAGYRLLVDP